MNEGEIVLSGGPEIFYAERETLRNIGLKAPPVVELAERLRQAGVAVPEEVSGEGELVEALCSISQMTNSKGKRTNEDEIAALHYSTLHTPHSSREAVIEINNLSYSYSPGTAFKTDAIKNVTCTIREGDFLGIIGHTGSGKSTLAQHLNGLIRMQMPNRRQRRRGMEQGTLTVLGMDLSRKKFDKKDKKSEGLSGYKAPPGYKALRSAVGMVFQYPEYQLFDETVLKDVGFGPRNIGLPADEIAERCKWAIEAVGLDFDEIKDKSPFELSGGQKRRAAIAGVIAMKPRILILDEPTAGLDPKGREEIMGLVLRVREEGCPTTIMISHDMDEIARRCGRILVLNGGRLEFDLPTGELYANHAERLLEIGLNLPLAARLSRALNARGVPFPAACDEENFAAEAAKLMNRNDSSIIFCRGS